LTTNQLAKLMVDILTGQAEDRAPTPEEQAEEAKTTPAKRGPYKKRIA
jgi:hypothetical protein